MDTVLSLQSHFTQPGPSTNGTALIRACLPTSTHPLQKLPQRSTCPEACLLGESASCQVDKIHLHRIAQECAPSTHRRRPRCLPPACRVPLNRITNSSTLTERRIRPHYTRRRRQEELRNQELRIRKLPRGTFLGYGALYLPLGKEDYR